MAAPVTIIERMDPASDPRWDRFVERHPFGWLTHLSAWQKVLEGSFDHMKGHYLAITDQAGGEIRAGLPVFEVRSWLTGKRLVSIPFATLSDPLVSAPEEFHRLLEGVLALAERTNARFVEIRTLHAPPLIGDDRMTQQQFYKHHSLRLDREPELLKSSFHRSCVRQRIARSISSGLTLRHGNGVQDVQILYRLYTATRRRLGLPPQPFRFFLKMWEVLQPANLMTLLIAEQGSTPVAALLLLKHGERVSAEVAVMDEARHDISPNHFLFWEGIRLAWHEGYRTFDFGRTSPHNGPLMDFKGRWGTEVTDLPVYFYPRQSAAGERTEAGLKRKLFKTVCAKAPDPLFAFMGRLCYRHMG